METLRASGVQGLKRGEAPASNTSATLPIEAYRRGSMDIRKYYNKSSARKDHYGPEINSLFVSEDSERVGFCPA